MKILVLAAIALVGTMSLSAQPCRWQQRVKYTMDIDMDVNTNRLTGRQKLEYTNNSPDTLNKVFYHLYFNAFQPNSMMDTRSRSFYRRDQDSRVRDRILHLQPHEIGYQEIVTLKMNGVAQQFTVRETILEVRLLKPVLPGTTVVFDMSFKAQVPLQVRRSGRDNPNTGVRFSMSQWYPKMCEYDYEGWHPTPYIAREFFGVWGDFDVKISLDKKYLLGGTGYLQNANQIGYGYEAPGTKVTRPAGDKLTWHFIAPNVHDFMWAADPDYQHIVRKAAHNTTIHVLYNRDSVLQRRQFESMTDSARSEYNNDLSSYRKLIDQRWTKVADAAVLVLPFIEKNFGDYPYRQYSFIHGGDGGMEYPMATLLVGPGLGTVFHEWMHTWYQMILATNESLYAWMDEGFTSYAETLVSEYYRQQTSDTPTHGNTGTGPRRQHQENPLPQVNPHKTAYDAYFELVKSGWEEPLTTHADHFNTNYAYSVASYSKGEIFMEQLGYITGAEVRNKILLEYYRVWRFKHPNINDFMRIAEKRSDMKLDWYREYWVNSTKTINYGIDSVWGEQNKTMIRIVKKGDMPMPIDLQLTYNDGSKHLHYIPMYLMFGRKPVEFTSVPRTVHEDWKWTHPSYTLEINTRLSDILRIEIDPTQRMADIDNSDNRVEVK